MLSGSPPFDNSNTATNSESGNGGSNSREGGKTGGSNEKQTDKKVCKDKSEPQEGSSAGSGLSGDKLYSGDTGTSGGVSAAANAHHKRIHAHTYRTVGSGGSGGSGVDTGSGYNVCNPVSSSPWDNYKPPLLTEQLLSAHNRGMEKKMIDSYKEGKRGDLKFLKNKLRRAAHHQAMKKAHSHHPWKHVNDKVHKTLNPRPAVNPAVVDPQASTIQLWPPFSVANGVAATLPIQVRPTQSQPLTTMLSSTAQVASSHQQQHQQLQRPNLTEGQSSAAAGSTQAMYSNLIPAYYIPPHISSNQKPTGGYFVSVPTLFSQQPLQVQTFQGLYHPMDHGLQAGNFRGTPSQMRGPGLIDGSSLSPEAGRVAGHQGHQAINHHRQISPDLQNTYSSIDSSIIDEHANLRSIGNHDLKSQSNNRDRAGSKPSFKFQRPPSRTGSRATSVKGEPGSALESNLESNASISASVKAIKMPSPGYRGFIATGSDRGLLQEQVMESTDSSMYSLLKSSDDFTPTTSNGSEEDEKDCGGVSGGLARPNLPDPFWLTNVEMTPQLTFNYQAKPRDLSEVLKRDYEFLKKVNQPNQVNEQLAQLYRELEDRGATIKPLLEEEASASCTSSSSSSSADDDNVEEQKQRQV